MKPIRGAVKLLMFAVAVLIFLAVTFFGHVFIRNVARRRHYFTDVVHAFAKWGVWFLNVQVVTTHAPPRDQNFLFISNHLGILDIVVLASITPTLFITSVEMKNTPGLGLLCEMGGCLFVERRDRSNIHKEIDQIRIALQQGVNVTLYPEGTSTNGERVLPFKKSLLTAAAGTGVPVLPLVVNYTKVDGAPTTALNRDQVCWYGDQSFPPVFWRLLTNRSVVAEVEFFDEVHVTSDEQRREIAAYAHQVISANFKPIL
ncbi:MAG: 1-acyl-sn-glycerol-3-phosphate acyltransferase [Bdellovibrionaceae bacterium]|nr:1-acyl-sn-glycerol-3-phosphate acyltransferase [Pseudobdellovibrionaceae bacterium]